MKKESKKKKWLSSHSNWRPSPPQMRTVFTTCTQWTQSVRAALPLLPLLSPTHQWKRNCLFSLTLHLNPHLSVTWKNSHPLHYHLHITFTLHLSPRCTFAL